VRLSSQPAQSVRDLTVPPLPERLSSDWEAQASLERYLRSTNGMALLGAIDVLSERAAVKIGHDAPWERIDLLKRMRRK